MFFIEKLYNYEIYKKKITNLNFKIIELKKKNGL